MNQLFALLSGCAVYACASACSTQSNGDPAPASSTTQDTTLTTSNQTSTSAAATLSGSSSSSNAPVTTSQTTGTASQSGQTSDSSETSLASTGGATTEDTSSNDGSSQVQSTSTSTMVASTTSGAESSASGSSDTSEATTQSASPGCEASTSETGDTQLTVDVGGVSRSFILHVPASYDGSTPVPFIIDFHPLGGSGSQEKQGSGYQAIADNEGLVIAFPDGIDNAWNVGPCCTNSRDVDDVGFARAIVEQVAAQTCIDMKRVYAVGFSMGGGMSHYLACQAADVFAAVAPAAFDLLVPEEQTCEPSRPISVLAFRGTQDTTSPFNGGPGPSGRATFEGAYGSFERWREMDGCNEVNSVDGECTTYEECSAGVQVALCVKEGGGHATGDANVGWAFLQRFSLP